MLNQFDNEEQFRRAVQVELDRIAALLEAIKVRLSDIERRLAILEA
jgi:hypothetical protein